MRRIVDLFYGCWDQTSGLRVVEAFKHQVISPIPITYHLNEHYLISTTKLCKISMSSIKTVIIYNQNSIML